MTIPRLRRMKWMTWCTRFHSWNSAFHWPPLRRRLTIATIVCLPLTLLTGYFVRCADNWRLFYHSPIAEQGMNFQPFWAVNNNSDLLFVFYTSLPHPFSWQRILRFWKIALPIMVLVVPLSIWGDLVRGWHYVQKKALLKNSLKVIQNVFLRFMGWDLTPALGSINDFRTMKIAPHTLFLCYKTMLHGSAVRSYRRSFWLFTLRQQHSLYTLPSFDILCWHDASTSALLSVPDYL